MKRLTHWKCSICRKLKKLGTEIARADMNAVCKSCQQGQSDVTPSQDVTAGQPVYVRRKGLRTPGNHDRNEPQ